MYRTHTDTHQIVSFVCLFIKKRIRKMKKSKKKTKKRRVDFQNEASRWTKCFSLDRFMFFVCFHHAPIAFLIFKSSRHVFGLCSSSASCFRFLFYPEKLSQSCNRWAMRMGGIWSGRRCWPYNTARIPTREHTHTLREKKKLWKIERGLVVDIGPMHSWILWGSLWLTPFL